MKKLFVIMVIGILISLDANAQDASSVGIKQTISILGDSYSTFQGYIPESYPTYYYSAPADLTRSDVIDVKQTWWWKVIKEGGYKLE